MLVLETFAWLVFALTARLTVFQLNFVWINGYSPPSILAVKGDQMTEMDKALVSFREDTNDPKNQSMYYDLFLNSTFFVPTLDERDAEGADAGSEEQEVLPLIIESEGNDYLMLFDSKERLHSWAQADAECVEVPGHVLAATTRPPLHWALNVGTEYSKQFVPDEIGWLRDAVERCNAEAAAAAMVEEGS